MCTFVFGFICVQIVNKYVCVCVCVCPKSLDFIQVLRISWHLSTFHCAYQSCGTCNYINCCFAAK